ncbi:MAG: hypothetical protein GX794_02765 [Acholeplasmataceae bacterium]|nr:hypothetical protein [Acholeplasmataceae bacterium]
MYDDNRMFYKITGSNKNKLEELTLLMLGIKLEPLKINNYFSIELFTDFQEINVPRHLIVGDITLTFVVFSPLEYLGEITTYYNGLATTKIDYFSYIILRSDKILSYSDFAINYLKDRYSKEFNQSFLEIENTNLYHSIISEVHNSFTRPKWREKTNVVMNRNFQKHHDKFKLASNLDVKAFSYLFI